MNSSNCDNYTNNYTKSQSFIFFILKIILILCLFAFKDDTMFSFFIFTYILYYTIRINQKKSFNYLDIFIIIFLIFLFIFKFKFIFWLITFIMFINSLIIPKSSYLKTSLPTKKDSDPKYTQDLNDIASDFPFSYIIFIEKKIIYANNIFKNIVSFDVNCDILKILPQYKLEVFYQTLKVNNSIFQVYTRPAKYKNYENCYISYFVLVENS